MNPPEIFIPVSVQNMCFSLFINLTLLSCGLDYSLIARLMVESWSSTAFSGAWIVCCTLEPTRINKYIEVNMGIYNQYEFTYCESIMSVVVLDWLSKLVSNPLSVFSLRIISKSLSESNSSGSSSHSSSIFFEFEGMTKYLLLASSYVTWQFTYHVQITCTSLCRPAECGAGPHCYQTWHLCTRISARLKTSWPGIWLRYLAAAVSICECDI